MCELENQFGCGFGRHERNTAGGIPKCIRTRRYDHFILIQELSTYLQESAGVILDVGKDSKHLQKQVNVLLSFDFCGSCQECKSDHPAHCQE
jgi:threonine dehydrogenase-like Zn-dependent dehydrogenase